MVAGIQNTEGSTFMTIADMSVVTAEVKVDETDIVNVKIGQPAEVSVDAIPGKVFKGHVTLVGDQALLRSTGVATSQSTTGTEEAKDFKVVVTLDNRATNCGRASPQPPRSPLRTKSNVLSLPIQALTMYTPPAPTKQRKRGSRLQLVRPEGSSGAGRLRRREGCSWQAARQVRPRHHRHHRRNRYRGALRPQKARRSSSVPTRPCAL